MNTTLDKGGLERLVDTTTAEMSPEVARWILTLRASDKLEERYHELADKNTEGTITPEELQELEDFVNTARVFSVLNARARKVLAGANAPS